jgi:KNOX1 domain
LIFSFHPYRKVQKKFDKQEKKRREQKNKIKIKNSSLMAFHGHLSHDMGMASQYGEQHLGEEQAVLRSAMEQLGPDDKPQGPSWLNSAMLRHGDGSFLHLQTAADSSPVAGTTGGGGAPQWLPRLGILQQSRSGGESMIGGDGGTGGDSAEGIAGATGDVAWENATQKAEILAHPWYEQLLSAHVACLRIATPVDQLQRIDEQLAQSQHVMAKYSALGAGTGGGQLPGDDRELDQFMVSSYKKFRLSRFLPSVLEVISCLLLIDASDFFFENLSSCNGLS